MVLKAPPTFTCVDQPFLYLGVVGVFDDLHGWWQRGVAFFFRLFLSSALPRLLLPQLLRPQSYKYSIQTTFDGDVSGTFGVFTVAIGRRSFKGKSFHLSFSSAHTRSISAPPVRWR